MSRPRLTRLLRISLRTVFVLTTVLCVWLGWKVNQVQKQKEVIAWIEDHGGTVVYDHEVSHPFTDVDPQGPKWLRDTLGINYFVTPATVELTIPADDVMGHIGKSRSRHRQLVQDLSPLANLSDLKALVLNCSDARDLSPLANLQSLTELILSCDEAPDLSPLADMKNLRELSLWCNRVDDLSPLLNATKLEILLLPASVTDEEIEMVSEALTGCQVAVYENRGANYTIVEERSRLKEASGTAPK